MGLKESVTFFATLSIQLCYDICQTNWIWKQQNSIADDLGHHIGSRGGRCVLEKSGNSHSSTLAFHVCEVYY